MQSGDPVRTSEDLDRILALPRRAAEPPGDASARYARHNDKCLCAAKGRECITQLRPVQSWALTEMGQVAGLLAPIGVGHGKTVLDLLAPMAVPNCKVAVLLVPPNLRAQLIKEYELVGQHFRMPSIVVHGKSYTKSIPGAPILHVFPYSLLSSAAPERRAFLNKVSPDLVIADECHMLKAATAARTMRFLRYFDEQPETRFCGWSGSMTDKSIKDYAHLAELALRDGSPLPGDSGVLEDWARAIDPSEAPSPPGALLQLCAPLESVQEGYHRRLVETRGVVPTREPPIAAEILLHRRGPVEVPEVVCRALDELRRTWVRPDGEELVDALALAKSARELSCGFYYRWVFPRGEAVSLIMRWLEARKVWNKEVRDVLKLRVENLDSPKLVENAARRACGDLEPDRTLPALKSTAWPVWRDIREQVQPETEAVRISDFLVQDAARWAQEQRGIVWTAHREFGAWVAEVAGIPMHGGGPKSEERISREKGGRSIVASIQAHGTGRDGLQRLFSTQLIATPPSSPTAWEQTLGRLHRVGQEASSVSAYYYDHTPELKEAIQSALTRAEYIQTTIGAQQKIVGKLG